MSKLRIGIVDDHALLRSGIIAMVEYNEGVEVVFEADNGLTAIELFDEYLPDILVMDVTMPQMGGIEAAQHIMSRHPDAKILLMTQHEEPQFIEAMLEADIAGCIGKRAAGTEFVSALKAVERGEFYLHPAIARQVAQNTRKRFVQPAETLTMREREVLELIVQGYTNGQIATELTLSIKTVEWHRSNLMAKLDVHSVAELVRYALDNNLIGGNAANGSNKPIDRL